MITDSILIDNVLRGDNKAFESLINKYQNNIYGFLYKGTLNKEDAEDLMQEVFIRAYKNLYTLENKSNFYHWIFKIAVNSLNNYYNSRKNSTLELDETFENVKSDDKYTPENMLELKEQSAEILKRLSILSDDQKNIILLKFVHGFSYREISKFLGMKEETVKMKAFRAKKKLFVSCDFEIKKGGIVNEM